MCTALHARIETVDDPVHVFQFRQLPVRVHPHLHAYSVVLKFFVRSSKQLSLPHLHRLKL
jgi:hypothetical protein